MKTIIILISFFLILSITLTLTLTRHEKKSKEHHSYKEKHHSYKKKHHKRKKHHSKKYESKYSHKHKTKNVYVYNNHFHLDKLPPFKEIKNDFPNLQYSNIVHNPVSRQQFVHRQYVQSVKTHVVASPNPINSHYVPKVVWVNDNQVQANIVQHPVPTTVAGLSHTHTLVHPEIVPNVAHVNHYPHQEVATYHVRNKQEADLVYDNMVAPNPYHHHHAYVN